MATIDEVLRAFLGKGKPLPRATRSGNLTAKLNQFGVTTLYLGPRVMAARYAEYIVYDVGGHAWQHYLPKLTTLIEYLRNSEGLVLPGKGRWNTVPADLIPSELIVWGDFNNDEDVSF